MAWLQSVSALFICFASNQEPARKWQSYNCFGLMFPAGNLQACNLMYVVHLIRKIERSSDRW